jgi:signal transduction histidine kinase
MTVLNHWLQAEKRRLLKSIIESGISDEFEVQQFAEFGRFSAGLIHDIATPLTAAILALEQIRDERPNSMIKLAQNDLRQLEQYVVAARTQLKKHSLKTSFSVNDLIYQVVLLLKPRARSENIRLVTEITGSYCLYGDAVRLSQTLANLINNAIEAYSDIPSRRLVKVTLAGNESWIKIAVVDYGKGIKKADHTRIFDPFYSTKQEISRGIGIGLAVVKLTVEKEFNGRVEINSKIGTGTTFTLTIPRSKKT